MLNQHTAGYLSDNLTIYNMAARVKTNTIGLKTDLDLKTEKEKKTCHAIYSADSHKCEIDNNIAYHRSHFPIQFTFSPRHLFSTSVTQRHTHTPGFDL